MGKKFKYHNIFDRDLTVILQQNCREDCQYSDKI